ncbi:hypothetical protein RHMOL_Rhmol13G0116200 [Rhododendron molle]|uniref:Uncharacterized protein n=1 Tax=Rhododendron molle TaxID=49168 RepID=A0ACC0L676_RHOML|nr:hypothetical protein RHMOL_Rhmol13G0116200 [Rhododendron molle]
MRLSRGTVIVREELLGPEPHGFGYTMSLPVTALKTDLRTLFPPSLLKPIGVRESFN